MARNRPDTKLFLIHCAATRAVQDIGAIEINKWHEKRGIHSDRGLTGYHFIIRRSGTIELGRELREIGAHARGYNDDSVGICLVGGVKKAAVAGELIPDDNFTDEQYDSLETLIRLLWRIYPEAAVIPHNLVSIKACPSFDVWAWQRNCFGRSDKRRAMSIVARIDNEEKAT